MEGVTSRILQAVGILSFFVGWEIVGRAEVTIAIPPASQVLPALWDGVVDGELLRPAAGTLLVAGVGYAVAAVLGIALGMLTGLSRLASTILDPLIDGGYATPMTMLIPVIAVWTGVGFTGKVALVVSFCIFIIIMNTATGCREVAPEHREAAAAFRTPRWRVYTRVVLPSAAPFIATGLRVSVGRAVGGAITAELLMAASNLGLYLLETGSNFAIVDLVAATMFVALLGASVMYLAGVIERRAMSWTRL